MKTLRVSLKGAWTAGPVGTTEGEVGTVVLPGGIVAEVVDREAGAVVTDVVASVAMTTV